MKLKLSIVGATGVFQAGPVDEEDLLRLRLPDWDIYTKCESDQDLFQPRCRAKEKKGVAVKKERRETQAFLASLFLVEWRSHSPTGRRRSTLLINMPIRGLQGSSRSLIARAHALGGLY